METVLALLEKFTPLMAVLAAVLSLITAVVPLIKKNRDNQPSTINVTGENNSVAQENCNRTYIVNLERKDVVNNFYVKPLPTNTNSTTLGIDGITLIGITVLLTLLLYNLREFLLQGMYILLVICSVLSLLICGLGRKKIRISPVSSSRIKNVFFAFLPLIIVASLKIQHMLHLFDSVQLELGPLVDALHNFPLLAAIFLNCCSILLLLLAQLSVLLVARVRSPKFRNFLIRFSYTWVWALSPIFSFFPILFYFLDC